VTIAPDRHPGYRFPKAVIAHSVWLYHRFRLSLRDTQDLLFERGVFVSHETIRTRCEKFGPEYAAALKYREPRRGDTWSFDEVFLKVKGQTLYLCRAIDQDGFVLDILLQDKRDTDAAEAFFRRLLDGHGYTPRTITTDKLGSYGAAIKRIRELHEAEHVEVRAALRANNRVERSHEETRERERGMRNFRSVEQAQRFLSVHARVQNLFRTHRHRVPAERHRRLTAQALEVWGGITGTGSVA